MGLGGVIGWIDRLAARFNKWIGPTAVASETRNTDMTGSVDAVNVTAVLGEIEQRGKEPTKDA